MSDPTPAITVAVSPTEFLAQLRDDQRVAVSYATPTPMVVDSLEAGTDLVFVREVGTAPGGDEVHAEPYPRLAGPALAPGDVVLVAEVIGRGSTGSGARVILGAIGGEQYGLPFTGSTQTTVGAAGGASALPATPTGYLTAMINGVSRVIPYYNAS